MKKIAFYDGTFADYESLRIPLSDRSVFFGDGIYDAVFLRNGKMFLKEEHRKRFFNNLQIMNLSLPYSDTEVDGIVSDVVGKFGEEPGFFYIQASRSGKERSHTFDREAPCHLLITAEAMPLPAPKRQLSLISTPDIRHGLCAVKTTNLLANVMASQKAKECGADEAVLLLGDEVTECAHSSIFIIRNETVITRPLDGRILPGVTREKLLKICHKQKIPYEERCFTYKEVSEADDVLITSTSKLCVCAKSLDGKNVGKSTPLAALLCREMYLSFLSETQSSGIIPTRL